MKNLLLYAATAALLLLAGCGSGDKKTEPDPVPGIPGVEGLSATFDTLQGTATLTWNRSAYPGLADYVIYRLPLTGDAPITAVAIGRTTDTVFLDGVREAVGREDFRVQYRVRIRDREDDVGPGGDGVILHAPPAGMVLTATSFLADGLDGEEASIKDTIRFIVQYHNPTRDLVAIEWTMGGPNPATRERSLSGNRGSDTLVVVPDTPCTTDVEVSITDAGGGVRTVTHALKVLLDPPAVTALVRTRKWDPAELPLNVGDTVFFTAQAANRFGRITKWEWDFGNTGTFVTVGGPDTAFVPAISRFDSSTYVARVTDDDGLTALDTVKVYYAPMVPRTPRTGDLNYIRKGPFPFYPAGSHLLSMDQGFNARVYSIDNGSWNAGRPITTQRQATVHPSRLQFAGIQAVGDRIFLLAPSEAPDTFAIYLQEYDFSRNEWELKTPMPVLEGNNKASMAALDGKLYICELSLTFPGPVTFWMYDPASDTWTRKSDLPATTGKTIGGEAVSGTYWKLAPIKGRIAALREEIYTGQSKRTFVSNPDMGLYDPTTDAWTVVPGQSVFPGQASTDYLQGTDRFKVMEGANTLWILEVGKTLRAFDAASRTWAAPRDISAVIRHESNSVTEVVHAEGTDTVYWMWHGNRSDEPQSLRAYDLATGASKVLLGAFPDITTSSMVHYNRRLYFHDRWEKFYEYRLDP